jgi:serine/threonine protein kinase
MTTEHKPRYHRIRELGRGGMGTVYLGTRELPGGPQPVALKALPDDRRLRAYAERGARMAMEWRHPALAAVFDCNDEYIVMEWIDGVPADHAAALSPMPAPVLRAVLLAVRGALAELDRHGARHRDIKPDNIMIAHDGRIVLIDYDLVTAGGPAPTITRSYKGTPAYSSPEHLVGAVELGPESDLYSLAATAYHLVTGQPPYGRGPAQVIRGRHRHDEPEPLPPELPEDLAHWIMVGLRLRAGELVLTGPVACSTEVAAYLATLPMREPTALADEPAPVQADEQASAPALARPPRTAIGWLLGAATAAALSAAAPLFFVMCASGSAPAPQQPAPVQAAPSAGDVSRSGRQLARAVLLVTAGPARFAAMTS